MKVFQMNMFIRTVEVVGISAPPEQQGIESEDLFEAEHDRYRAPLSEQDRGLPKGGLDSPFCSRQPITGRVEDKGFAAMKPMKFKLDSRRAERSQEGFERIEHAAGVHVRNKSTGNFCECL